MTQGGMVAFAFPVEGFRIFSDIIESPRIENATEVTRRLIAKAGVTNSRIPNEGLLRSCSPTECPIARSSWSAPFRGSSAAFPWLAARPATMRFLSRRICIHNGSARSKVAILIVGKPKFPFRTFSVHNLRPKPIKLVVTRADPDNRIVAELNAEPAATEYANAIGIDSDQLGPLSFASYPLAVKVGENYYCRSIRKVNPDGSLLFFCAVDEGLVFTAAYPHNIVESTAGRTWSRLKKNLKTSILFSALIAYFGGWMPRASQSRHLLEELYKRYNVIGFHTYGEQFNGLHLNQTLTGIAFAAWQIGCARWPPRNDSDLENDLSVVLDRLLSAASA